MRKAELKNRIGKIFFFFFSFFFFFYFERMEGEFKKNERVEGGSGKKGERCEGKWRGKRDEAKEREKT
jgi:hypothetical protein